MEQETSYDDKLWFNHKGCDGKHFLIGNPHTFHGRMWAWCPVKQRSFFVSKDEILESSEQTKYWVKGFLSGNQPSPPKNENQDVDYTSDEYKLWKENIREFEQSGIWDIEQGM